MQLTQADERRFWRKVIVAGLDECWEWRARSRVRHGYGYLCASGRREYAHRVAWTLTYGPIPSGLYVLHRCDNPPCCNPAHLFLGTHAENMADCAAKHRTAGGDRHWTHRTPEKRAGGERHGSARLSAGQVAEIRELHAQGVMQKDLAATYGVSKQHLSDIICGKRWAATGPGSARRASRSSLAPRS